MVYLYKLNSKYSSDFLLNNFITLTVFKVKESGMLNKVVENTCYLILKIKSFWLQFFFVINRDF